MLLVDIMNTKMRNKLRLKPDNDNEPKDYQEVCTSRHCKPWWVICNAAGVCSHGNESDCWFNACAYRAYSDFISGRVKTKCDAARKNGISIREFLLYRKAMGFIK